MTKHTISCPKCGFVQETSEECTRCGIIFQKFNRIESQNTTGPIDTTSARYKTKKVPIISFRTIRIIILLFVLFVVGVNAWLTKLRTTDWDQALWVVVYPVNGDGSDISSKYIESLDSYKFKAIESFMERGIKPYGLAISKPIKIVLAPKIDKFPPAPPRDGNKLRVILWSLKLRYWAFITDTNAGPSPDIQIYVVYFDPQTHTELEHSLGLEKGLIGVVNGFAGRRMEAENNVVITHEMLHTLGATDKYDLATGQPLYPEGYAEPGIRPLFPQRKAEIMAGRMPLSESNAIMPNSLKGEVIGEQTAREINWM